MMIRPARPDDRPAIAALHAASWQSAYRGALPDAYLDGNMPGELASYWEKVIPDQLLVAEVGDLVGFVSITDHDGPYVEALHVAPHARGQGVGDALMRAAARALAERGATTLSLTVLAQNTGAIRFYERLGGITGPEFADEMFGHPLTSHEVRWASLAPLTDPRPEG